MDFLEAHKEALEEGLYFRLADLLALDVELVFYDTTSVHFEVDEEDRAPEGEERVYGSRAAGAKPYRALRKRGKSKNGRDAMSEPAETAAPQRSRQGCPIPRNHPVAEHRQAGIEKP